MSDVSPVASSATDQSAPVSALADALARGDQEGYGRARQAERAGTPLPPIPPASAVGQPAEQVAETAASVSSPASEPGAASGHKGNADTRKAELQAEIQALLKQRAELRQTVPAASPQPPVKAEPASHPAPKAEGEPQLADFEAHPEQYPDPYAAFVEARADWRASQAIAKALAADRETRQRETVERETRDRAGALQAKINAAMAADPSLKDTILFDQFDAVPTSLLVAGEAASPQNDLAEALLDADQPTDLMRYLSDQPKDFAELLASPGPRAFWRALGRIEGRMSAPKRPVPKTITDAPAPPLTVGTRHESIDTLESALKSGDQAAYNAEMRRRRFAAARQ